MANTTIELKTLIPTFEIFSNYSIILETVSNMKMEQFADENWLQDTYRLLIRRYGYSEIMYNNPDAFMDRLAERIEIHAPNYYTRRTQYNKLLALSDEELKDKGYDVENFIEHTDTEVDAPLDTLLKQLSTQSQSKGFRGTAEAIRSQIYNAQMGLIDDYMSKFKNLFIRLNSGSNYFRI